LKPERESLGTEFYDALEVVLYPQEFVPLARQTEDIAAWHTSQVQQHFLQQVLPILSRLKSQPDPGALLLRCVKILETAHRQYLHGLSFIKEQIDTSGRQCPNPPDTIIMNEQLLTLWLTSAEHLATRHCKV
jgi:anaphase-promoting complex subunit 2